MRSKLVTRVDSGVMRADSFDETDEGFLKFNAPIARTGVYTYQFSDGTVIRELVTEDTLSSYEANSTLHLKPVTNSHPEDLLDTETVKEKQVGTVGENVWFDHEDSLLYSNFIVSDKDAIEAIKGGKQQLSPAYQCMLIEKSGIHDGLEYDVIQVSRRYNHLAIVDNARGGDKLKVKMDGADCTIGVCKMDGAKDSFKGEKMATIKVDSVDVDVSADVKSHVDGIVAQLDTAKETVKTLKEDAVKLESGKAELKTQLDAKDGELDAKVAEAVKGRVALVTALDSVMTDSNEDKAIVANVDSMSANEIHKAVIAKVQPNANLDGKSDEYVSARFDACIELNMEAKKDAEDADKKVNGQREKATSKQDAKDAVEGESDIEARKNMMKADSERWKGEEA